MPRAIHIQANLAARADWVMADRPGRRPARGRLRSTRIPIRHDAHDKLLKWIRPLTVPAPESVGEAVARSDSGDDEQFGQTDPEDHQWDPDRG